MVQGIDSKVITITKTKPNDGKKESTHVNDDSIEPKIIPKSISKLIVKLRNEMNMNQKDLQTKANVNAKVLSDWENGKGVWNVKTAEKLAKVLGVDVKEFEKLLNEKEKTIKAK
ncbi:hypothetical protein COBT_000833 [Conglomerata obtusa]